MLSRIRARSLYIHAEGLAFQCYSFMECLFGYILHHHTHSLKEDKSKNIFIQMLKEVGDGSAITRLVITFSFES